MAYTQQLDTWLAMAGFEHRKELHKLAQHFNLRPDGRPISSEQVWRVFKNIPYSDTPRKYALYAVLGVFYALEVVQREAIEIFLQNYDIPHPKSMSWEHIWQFIEHRATQFRLLNVEPEPPVGLVPHANQGISSAPRNALAVVASADEPRTIKLQLKLRNRRDLMWLSVGLLAIVLLSASLWKWKYTDSASASDRSTTSAAIVTLPPSLKGIEYEGIEEPPFGYPPNTVPHKFCFADGVGYLLSPEMLHQVFRLTFPMLSGNNVGGDGHPYFWMFLPDPNQINHPSISQLYHDPITMMVPLVDEQGSPTSEFLVTDDIYLDIPPADLPND